MTKSILLILFASGLARALPTTFSSPSNARDAVKCPLNLAPNNFEFPHLIVPVSSGSPNAAMGTTYDPTTSPDDVATIFNFDMPSSRSGQTCTVHLSLPQPAQMTTSSLSYIGSGGFEFAQYQYNTGAVAETTWNSQPPLSSIPPVSINGVMPGNSYVVWNGTCGTGGVWSWRMSSKDTCLWYFQDWNECAVGLYVVYN